MKRLAYLWKRDKWPLSIGGILGLAISGYALVYAPMKANHDECGRVTLCNPMAADRG